MYKKILIPIAFEHGEHLDTAIAAARLLADPGVDIVLLNVLEDIPAYVSAEIPVEIIQNVEKDANDRLGKIAGQAGAGARAVVVRGHAGITIVDYAEREAIDCIVIASHRPEFADYFLGSTAARVVRHAPCSVHVIR